MVHFKAVIKEKEKKLDGTWNVKIRVTHNREIAYIGTSTNVILKQLDENFVIIDQAPITTVGNTIKKYTSKIADIDEDELNGWSLKELTTFLKGDKVKQNQLIDFMKVGRDYEAKLRKEGRGTTANPIRSTLNALEKYMNGSNSISIDFVTLEFLQKFEIWLRSHDERVERVVKGASRRKATKKMVTVHKEMGNTAIGNYMRNIRTIFNVARKDANGTRLVNLTIKHYPFGKEGYDFPKEEKVESKALTPEILKRIQDFDAKTIRQKQAIEIFFISFFMMGSNCIDLYYCPPPDKDGYLTYFRHKTVNALDDDAEISIKMQTELMPYYDKYKAKGKDRAFNFSEHYPRYEEFIKAVLWGLKEVGLALKLKDKKDNPLSLTTYFARHSWASWGANKCGYSESVIDQGLAHGGSEKSSRMAKKYIDKDWTLINQANRDIIDYYHRETKPKPEVTIDFCI